MSEYTKVKIQKRCKMCKEVRTLEVDAEGWEMYQGGVHIQHALPELSADDRELLISGICGPCFDRLFADPEEDGPDWSELEGSKHDPEDSDEDDAFADWLDEI